MRGSGRALERKNAEAELRLRGQIAANLAEGVCLVRVRDTTVIWVNRRFEQMFGYEAGELNGLHASALAAPAEREGDEAVAEEIRGEFSPERGAWIGEVHNVRKDGTPFWCDVRVSSFEHPEHGEVSVAVYTDVTERRRVDAALRRERRLLAQTQTVSRVGSWEWELETGERRWSDEQYRLHGLDPAEPIPSSERFGDLLHEDDRARVADEMAARFGRPGEFEIEYRVQHGDFGPRVLLIRGGGQAIEDGEPARLAGTCRDVTAERQAEEELRRGARYFDLSRDLMVASSADGYFKTVNPALEHILGWSREEFLARPFLDMVHPDDVASTLAEVGKLAEGQVTFRFTNRYEAKDGGYRWLDWNAIVPPDEPLMYASARDVTQQKLTERYLEVRHEATRVLAEATTVDDALPALLEVIGSRMGWPVGSSWISFVDRAVSGLRCTHFWHELEVEPAAYRAATEGLLVESGVGQVGGVFEAGEPWWLSDISADAQTITTRARAASIDGLHAAVLLPILSAGKVVALLEFVSPEVVPEDPVQLGILDTLSGQISLFFERQGHKEELERLSRIDSLTGLHNRRHIEEVLGSLVSAARRHGTGFAVLVIDIDHFKQVNDGHGHGAGDEVLRATASALFDSLRTEDAVARWGGEEFLVALPGETVEGAATVAERMRAGIAGARVDVSNDLQLGVTVTIGATAWAGDSVDEVVQRADAALYRGKVRGRNTVEVCSSRATAASAAPPDRTRPVRS